MLKASKTIDVRFSEVDMMKVVWHGSYPVYFEDAREEFGRKFGLTYQGYLDNQCYAPIVDLTIHYHKPIIYGCQPRIDIIYKPTMAAKVVFDYEIHDAVTDELYATGHSVQVFIDLNYQLMLYNPPFYEAWKKKWNL